MPTGYTANLTMDTPLKEFVLRCSRAMGALVMMRDEPMDAPIPDECKPSDYYEKAVKKDTEKLQRLLAMTDAEATEAMKAEQESTANRHIEHQREMNETRQAYERMMALVLTWSAPTPDHQEFKTFMLEQLRESIRFDCYKLNLNDPVYSDSSIWRAEKIKEARKSLDYHKEEMQKDIDRCKARTAWIKALKSGL